MNYEDYIADALELCSAWNLVDDELADAVNDQARLMAGVDFDDGWGLHIEAPYAPF
jgi:hypothetical protein